MPPYLAILVAATLTALPCLGAPDRATLVAELANPILDKQLAPGLVIGIIENGQREVIPLGFLTYDQAAAPDADTVYEIGSISKVFTSLLLADAQHRGEINENDTLAEHLPEGVVLDTLDEDPPIRLFHLATHSSGLSRMPGNIHPEDPLNPFAGYTREMLWEYLDGLFPDREPLESYHYSNLAVGLLGTVVAMSAGSTYEELLHDRIATPLGLADTTITLSADQARRLAPPFVGTTPNTNWDFDCLAGCGAIRSTASDLLTLAQAVLDPPSKTAPESLLDAIESTQSLRYSPGPGKPNVALGWHLAGPDDQVLWHNGGTGGYSTFFAINTENQTAVVVLANGSTEEITALGFRLIGELSRPQE